MLLDAWNAGNRISELLDFEFSPGGEGIGACPQTPLGERGFTAAYN